MTELTIELRDDGSIFVHGMADPRVQEWCLKHARKISIGLDSTAFDVTIDDDADKPVVIGATP